MRALASLLVYFGLAVSAGAQSVVTSEAADETRLTIYPANLAMVTETRRVRLPKGATTLRFMGVSDQIIPQTVVLQEFEGLTIEQNFDSDLLSKGSLLSNAIGETITIRRTNRATGEITRDKAVLIAASPGTASAGWDYRSQSYTSMVPVTGAVFSINGDVEAYECAVLAESIIFHRMPESLNPTPVLSIDVSSEKGGEAALVVSYLTSGMSWAADYRVDVNDNHSEGAVVGWLTVTNSTAKTFKDVPTAIVAGEVNRSGDTRGDAPVSNPFYASCWPKGSTKTGIAQRNRGQFTNARSNYSGMSPPPPPAPDMLMEMEADEIVVTASRTKKATREDLGDYKLYRTPNPVTVAAHQTKQIAFLGVPDAELEHLFKFRYEFGEVDEPRGAVVEYEIDNSKEGRLAQPLPKGTIRVMTKRANGQTAFLGEDSIENLAVDLPVEVGISTSPSVLIRETVTGVTDKSTDPATHKIRLSGEIINANPVAIMAEVKIDDFLLRQDNFAALSHTLEEDDIIPTIKFSVAAESAQEFYADIPLERTHVIRERQITFPKDEVGAKDVSFAEQYFHLPGQFIAEDWASEYFEDNEDIEEDDVIVRSEILELDIPKRPDGVVFSKWRLRHVFENESESTSIVHFVLRQSALDSEIVYPSFAPSENDPVAWTFTMKPGEKRELTYTQRYVARKRKR